MAYRLKPGSETVEAGLKRIADEEFARIAHILSDAELSYARQVHEVRKSTKRIRSLIRLFAPTLATAKAESMTLRDAARALSSARDTGAILDSLERLKLPAATKEAMKAALADNSGKTSEPAKLLKAFGRDIRAAAKKAAAWHINADGFEAIRPGLGRSYKTLRDDFAAAARSRDEEAIHTWRKSAKVHWHHTILLGRICPDAIDAHARMACRLSESLGDWRDTGLLIAALDALTPEDLDKDSLKGARRAASADQKRLLKKAERISSLLTAEKPKALAARWAAYWAVSTA